MINNSSFERAHPIHYGTRENVFLVFECFVLVLVSISVVWIALLRAGSPPEKTAFAQAMLRLIKNESLCAVLAGRARRLVEQEHSYAAFKATVNGLYGSFEQHMCK